jgi:hypothetical protein
MNSFYHGQTMKNTANRSAIAVTVFKLTTSRISTGESKLNQIRFFLKTHRMMSILDSLEDFGGAT